MHTTYDRWIWIELIGFDNEREDYGVSAFLENAGFVPEVASLLLFNADFIHQHDGLAQERPLPDDVCSYAGHPSTASATGSGGRTGSFAGWCGSCSATALPSTPRCSTCS